MPFQRDESGQWWYVTRNYRSRAYARTCAACGDTFYARRSDRTRYCKRECGLRGERHPHWRGGRHLQKGYVLILADRDDPIAQAMRDHRGYVPEHRLVLARALRRPLRRTEYVHHVNGDKADNRLENLELRIREHGGGIVYQCSVCGSRRVEPAPLDPLLASMRL